MPETVEVDKGMLFTVLRTAQSHIQYLRDPNGYKDEDEMQQGFKAADFIETVVNSLVMSL